VSPDATQPLATWSFERVKDYLDMASVPENAFLAFFGMPPACLYWLVKVDEPCYLAMACQQPRLRWEIAAL
jgi:hypothetical protein